MRHFIFYTPEGYCEAPDGESSENYQVLGFEDGETSEKALETLLNNNGWIIEYGYNPDKIMYRELL